MQEATVLDLKQLIHGKQSDLPPFLQRLTHRTPGGASTKLEDSFKLSAYPEVTNGCTLYLIRLVKFELYVHDARGNLHSLIVPSNEPEVYNNSLEHYAPYSARMSPENIHKLVGFLIPGVIL